MIQSLAKSDPASAAPAAPCPQDQALQNLCSGKGIDQAAARQLFAQLVDGALADAQIAAMLIALRLKGESVDELAGAAAALRAAALHFPRPDYLFADCCGTGGDRSGSINVSTAVGLVAAAAGLPIAKHGNRSVSSRCGSADVLEALGARLEISPDRSRRILDETGFCFLFAPLYHPGLKHAGPVRRMLKVPTIMNLIGPCLNPAKPRVQLLGVADPDRLKAIAGTLAMAGVESALVVHGAGLDEIALHGPTRAIRIAAGKMEELIITPHHGGLRASPLSELKGGEPGQNATRLIVLLSGDGSDAERDVVALNAGALLMTAGLASDLKAGTDLALEALRSGRALRVLKAFIEASHG